MTRGFKFLIRRLENFLRLYELIHSKHFCSLCVCIFHPLQHFYTSVIQRCEYHADDVHSSSWTGSVSSVSYGKKNQWRSAATDAPKTILSQLSLKLLNCKDKQYRQHNSVFSFGSIHWATQDNKNTIPVNIYIYIYSRSKQVWNSWSCAELCQALLSCTAR